jgi:hypothetical protein
VTSDRQVKSRDASWTASRLVKSRDASWTASRLVKSRDASWTTSRLVRNPAMRVNSRPRGYNGTQFAFADFNGGTARIRGYDAAGGSAPGTQHSALPYLPNLALRPAGCYRYLAAARALPAQRLPSRAGARTLIEPRERTTVADISVERKPRSSVPLIAGVLLLAVLGFVIWRYVSTHQAADTAAPVVTDSVAR